MLTKSGNSDKNELLDLLRFPGRSRKQHNPRMARRTTAESLGKDRCAYPIYAERFGVARGVCQRVEGLSRPRRIKNCVRRQSVSADWILWTSPARIHASTWGN